MNNLGKTVARRGPGRELLVALCLCLCLAAGAALAQDKGVSREREQLRRSQAALKQAQAQQEALAGEKAVLEQERNQIKGALDQASAQARAGSAEVQRLRGDANKLRADAERTRQELATETARAQQLQVQLDQVQAQLVQARSAHEAMQQQVRDVRREAAERSLANGTLTAMLERATQALAAAETRNRLMHAAGLAALERYRSKSAADLQAQNEPFLGLTAVQIENQAEELRTELDKHRLVKAQYP